MHRNAREQLFDLLGQVKNWILLNHVLRDTKTPNFTKRVHFRINAFSQSQSKEITCNFPQKNNRQIKEYIAYDDLCIKFHHKSI